MPEIYYKSMSIPLDRGAPEVQELLDYWHEKRGFNNMPLRENIAPWDFPRQLGRICIVEVMEDPLDFIYRIDGIHTSVSASSDLRNRSILDGEPMEIYRYMYKDLVASIEKKEPVLWHVNYGHDKLNFNYLRLTLPLQKKSEGDFLMTFSYNLDRIDGNFEAVR